MSRDDQAKSTDFFCLSLRLFIAIAGFNAFFFQGGHFTPYASEGKGIQMKVGRLWVQLENRKMMPITVL
jgi:hypothetical protein